MHNISFKRETNHLVKKDTSNYNLTEKGVELCHLLNVTCDNIGHGNTEIQ